MQSEFALLYPVAPPLLGERYMTSVSYLPPVTLVEDPLHQDQESKPAQVDRLLSRLADICSHSDKETLVKNLADDCCQTVGFGPMAKAIRQLS